jgi:hypothetical protein
MSDQQLLDPQAKPQTPCGDADVLALPLKNGGHSDDGEGFTGECCLVEKSNLIASCIPAFREKYGAAEEFGDDHPSISRVCRSMAIGLNDSPWESDDARTAALDRFSILLLGTNTGPEDEETRAWLATDWLVRVQTPAFLELAGLTDDAATLRALPALTSSEIAIGIQSALDGIRERASARSDAARAAAGAAARDAAWAAAGDAARDAAGDAARDAARAAAWAAAGDAAGDAARAAAGDAAGAAAWAAAGDAAGPLRGTLRGTLRGPLRGTLRGPLRGTLRGTLRGRAGTLRGTLRGPLRGTLRGPLRGLRGPLRGPLRGTLRGPLRGTLRGTLRTRRLVRRLTPRSRRPRRRCAPPRSSCWIG